MQTKSSPELVALDGLNRLEAVITAPDLDSISGLFAPEVALIIHGKAYALRGAAEVLTVAEELAKTANATDADRTERALIASHLDENGNLHATHVTRWFEADRVVHGPLSTIITYTKFWHAWRVSCVQMSNRSPYGITTTFAPFLAKPPCKQDLAKIEDVAEEICAALLHGSADDFLQRIKLPFVMQWDGSIEALMDEEEAVAHLKSTQLSLKRRGVKKIYRAATSAFALNRDQVYAHLTTYLMGSSDAHLLQHYANSMRLERGVDGNWVVTSLIDPRVAPSERARNLLEPAAQT